MNKQMKQHLNAVIDAIVESDTAAAKNAFHDYLRLKAQAALLDEAVESDEDEDDEKDKDDEDKDDKKGNPFAKKSDKKDKKSDKKDKDDEDEEDCKM